MATKVKARTGGIVLTASELKSALGAVAAAVGRTRPVLANVRIGDGLMSATDLEVRIDAVLDYHGDPILLPYSRLSAILRESSGDDVTLDPKGTSCTVRIGRGEWTLPTEDAAEFPTWEPENTSLVCRIPADQYRRAVNSVAYAIDRESSRYALGALRVEVSREESKAFFVATDGRRLALATAELGTVQDPDDSASLVIPDAAIAAGDLSSKDGQVEILRNDKEVVFNVDGATVIARQIEGRFPRWRDVFPKDQSTTTHTLAIKELNSVTRAASIVTSEQSKGVTYTFQDSALTLTARSSEAGESKVSCDVVNYGRDALVTLDPRFVLQMCKSLMSLEGSPVINVTLNSPGDAVVFAYGDDGEYKSVIMPLAPDA